METIIRINTYLLGPALTLLLLSAGIFCHIRFNGVLFSKIHHIVLCLFERRSDKNGISPFKAVTLALAGTLGVGNITGVAGAIISGGAGAVFWMWISALISTALKFSEVCLAVKYRQDGKGGAPYYIEKILKSRKMGMIFSILCLASSFTLGNMVQIKASADSFNYVFGIKPIYIGVILAFLCFAVIFKGVKSISDITVKLIPLLSLIYCFFSLYIIFSNLNNMPKVFKEIFNSAFSFKAAGGGIAGFFISRSVRYGISRGLASNESGCGTAPFAHAASNSTSPIKQGFWGVFEVFIDTIIICSMTAFVILLSPYKYGSFDAMPLVLNSYEYYLGEFSSYFMCFSILFYSLSSAVCWSYYGTEALFFIKKSKIYTKAYILLYCSVIILGAVFDFELIWELSDLTIGLMTLLNIICILLASKEIADMTKEYFKPIPSNKK
ncbi:MAG: alanine:cation symporter family protein [Ruminococcaceae bacterium]|nr:alanine:cation symporter family protein [Oscillospiraceae bacterium]